MRSNRTGYSKYLHANATPSERQAWEILRTLKDVRFRRQSAVGPYVLDFYSPRYRLCVEIDGPVHDPETDQCRDAWLAEQGICTLRFPAEDVNEEAIVSAVRAACARRLPKF